MDFCLQGSIVWDADVLRGLAIPPHFLKDLLPSALWGAV